MRASKAGAIAQFYDFAIARYQGDINALTEWVIEQPVDEYNRQSGSSLGKVRVPPSDAEIDRLFGGWAASLQDERRYLPAARNYFAASLWRRVGVRITESTKLDIRDWRPDLGALGKLHVRSGKARGDEGRSSGLCLRSTGRTSSSTGGSAMCGIGSALIGMTRMPR